MADNQLKRRLSALINADVVGYSRLMAEDELATVRSLTACRQKIGDVIGEHGGRLVDFAKFDTARPIHVRGDDPPGTGVIHRLRHGGVGLLVRAFPIRR